MIKHKTHRPQHLDRLDAPLVIHTGLENAHAAHLSRDGDGRIRGLDPVHKRGGCDLATYTHGRPRARGGWRRWRRCQRYESTHDSTDDATRHATFHAAYDTAERVSDSRRRVGP